MEKAIRMTIAFTIGNFIWEAFTTKNWGRAAERSFFQGVAFFSYALS